MFVHLIILGTGIMLGQGSDEVKYNTIEACYKGMKSLFDNNPNKGLFHKNVLNDSKDLSFEIEAITLIKMVDGHNCDVIAKDAKGFRSYRVSLEKNANFPHYYRIDDVKGQKIVSDYQWRTNL